MARTSEETGSMSLGSGDSGSILSEDFEVQDLAPDASPVSSQSDNSEPNIYDPSKPKANNSQETPSPQKSFWRKVLDYCRPGYFLDHLDYASFRVVSRSFCQNWITIFFLIIPACNRWFGPAAYLFQIIGFLSSSGGKALIWNIFDCAIASVYIFSGWLFMVVARAITYHIRGRISNEQLVELLINDGSCTKENIKTCLTQQVYSGRFLETRCTVIYIFAFVMYYTITGFVIRQNVALYKTPFILGCVNMSITMCYNNFWPTFDGMTINMIVVKPMMIAIAFRLFVSCVVFPDTASYNYFKGLIGVHKQFAKLMSNNLNFFMTMKPSHDSFNEFSQFLKDILKIRSNAAKLEQLAVFSKYEVSYSRMNAGTIGELRAFTKNLLTVTSGFEYFYQSVDERRNFAVGNILSLNRNRTMTRTSSMGHDSHLKLFGAIQEAYRPVGHYENNLRSILIKERLQKIPNPISLKDLDTIGSLLKTFYQPFLEVNIEAFQCITEWLEAANSYRFYTLLPGASKSHQVKQKELAEKLLYVRAKVLKSIEEMGTFSKFEFFRGKSSNEDTMMTLISLTSLVTYFTLEQARCLVQIMDDLKFLDETCPRPKWWTFFSHLAHSSAQNLYPSFNTEDHEEGVGFTRDQTIGKRDPDTTAPNTILNVIGSKIARTYFALLNDHLFFWFKASALVISCAIPFFCRSTANWYYRNRCVWVVIICAFGVSEYSGETIYSFSTKLIYSFLGCFVGCVGWYISAGGTGPGNYYGFAVVTFVLYGFMTYFRHFSVHSSLLPQIFMGLTTSLVMGTSWADRTVTGANVGSGLEVAYKRFVTVIVGLSVAFVVSAVPRPKSSKEAYRKILAKVVTEAGNLHCDVTSFALQRLYNPKLHTSRRHDPIVNRFRLVLMKLAGTASLMMPIKHEVSLTGDWPASKYSSLTFAINDFIQLYSLLLQVFNLIEDTDTFIPKLIRHAAWNNAEISADMFSVLHMTSDSLQTGAPLPKITPGTISLKHLDHLKEQLGVQRTTASEGVISEELHKKRSRGEGSALHQSMTNNIDFERLFTKDGNLNLVAVILSHFAYKRLDEIVIIVKSLVGEKYDINETVFQYNDMDYEEKIKQS